MLRLATPLLLTTLLLLTTPWCALRRIRWTLVPRLRILRRKGRSWPLLPLLLRLATPLLLTARLLLTTPRCTVQ